MKKLIIVFLLVIVFFLESSFAAFWPYPRGMQYCTGEGDGPKTSDIQRIWRSPIGGTTAPTIVDGRVYINNNGAIYCLSILDGTPLWKTPFYSKGESVNSPCGYYEGKIYFGNSSNKVFCLDAFTGRQIWTYNAGLSCDSQVTIVYGRVIIGAEYKLLCLDAKTGKLIWQIGSKNPNVVFKTQRLVYQNKIYAVLDDFFCIFDIMSGKLIKNITKVGNNHGCLLLGNNIIMKSDNQIISVNKDTNNLYRIVGSLSLDYQQSCTANGKYICTTNDNRVLIFDNDLLNNKEIDLKQHVGNTQQMLMSPISSNGLVFLGTKNNKLIIINTSKNSIDKVYEGTEYNKSFCAVSESILLIVSEYSTITLINKTNFITYKLKSRITTKAPLPFSIILPDAVNVNFIGSAPWISIKPVKYTPKGAIIESSIIPSKIPNSTELKVYILAIITTAAGEKKAYAIGCIIPYEVLIPFGENVKNYVEVFMPSDNPSNAKGEIKTFEKPISVNINKMNIKFIDAKLLTRIICDVIDGISTGKKIMSY